MIQQMHGTAAAEPEAGVASAWERTGGVFGLLTFVILLGGSLVLGRSNTLNSTATPAAISAYLSAHGSSVQWLTLVTVLGGATGLWFLSTVGRIIHGHDRRSSLGMIVLGSAAVATAISAFDGVTLTALVYLARQGGPSDPALVRTFFDLQNGLIMPGMFGFFVASTMAAAGVAMIRGHLARPWAGWLALILAAFAAAGAVSGLSSVGGGTTLVGYAPALGYGIFALVTSIFLLRSRGLRT